MIDILPFKIVLCFSFLLYASYTDVKYRIVENRVWKAMLLLAMPIIVFDLAVHTTTLHTLIISFSITSILTFGVYFFKIVGEADAKFFMILSLIFPISPTTTYISQHIGPSLFSLSLLGNALLITASWFYFLGIVHIFNKNYEIPKDLPFMVSILVAFPITLIVGDVLRFMLNMR